MNKIFYGENTNMEYGEVIEHYLGRYAIIRNTRAYSEDFPKAVQLQFPSRTRGLT